MNDRPKFIADNNVGKLVKWLRILGYDTVPFTGPDDADMILQALKEGRVVLTRDTGVMERGVVTSGRLKALLITSEDPEQQMRQVVEAFKLEPPVPSVHYLSRVRPHPG